MSNPRQDRRPNPELDQLRADKNRLTEENARLVQAHARLTEENTRLKAEGGIPATAPPTAPSFAGALEEIAAVRALFDPMRGAWHRGGLQALDELTARIRERAEKIT